MKSAQRFMVFVLTSALLALGLPSAAEANVGSVPAAGYPGFNGAVRVIVHSGNTVYVGGDFSKVTDSNGTFVRNRVAAFDATTGDVLRWNPNVTGVSVRAILVGKKAVYLGGQFSAVHGQRRLNLARVGRGPGSKLTAGFRHRTEAPVRALAFSAGRLLVGGDFMQFDGKRRWRTAAVGLRAPYRLRPWAPHAQLGGVKSILTSSKGIYLAGDFRQFDGRTRYQRLALVNTSSGQLVRGFNPPTRAVVFGIVRDGDAIVAAIGGPHGGQVMAVSASTGATLWTRGTDGDAQAIESLDGVIYVGGHFNRVCGFDTTGLKNCEADPAVRRRLVAFSGAGDLLPWDPDGNSSSGVWTLDGLADHSLAAGGAFTAMNAGTVVARRLAIFDPIS